MAATVWDPQYAGMESGESFQRSWAADREGICLGNEKFINFAYWIGGEDITAPPDAMGLPALHRCLNMSVTARLTMSRQH